MKKKLKLNKKTIAELSGSENVVGGVGIQISKKICQYSVNAPCVSHPNPCVTNDAACQSLKINCQTQICISDIECGSRDGRCKESVHICVQ